MQTSARRDELAPAALVLASGLLALALRPAVPLDETRYLEVARELGTSGPWLLTLNGEPYAHKPPLLFWLGWGLHGLGLPLETALRALPALASALTVWITARLGRRLGAPLAGWAQAALLLPLAYAHALYFDPLLTACVWLAFLAWSSERGALAWLACSAALLCKGPVAWLMLAPLLWAARRTGIGRLVALLLAGSLPLAVWALTASLAGGPAFQRELLWSQTAERVAGASSHGEPWWFLAAVLVLGSLPVAPVLLARGAAWTPWQRRMLWALALPLLILSLFPGKQPHYVLPLFPVLALLAAQRLEQLPSARTWLRAGASLVLALLIGALGVAWTQRDALLERYGEYGRELEASGIWRVQLALGALAAGAALLALITGRLRPRAQLAAFALAFALVLVPIEVAFGRLVLPRGIAQALRAEPETPLATLRGQQGGLYNLLGARAHVEDLRLTTTSEPTCELELWVRRHPGGLLVIEDKLWSEARLEQQLPALGLLAVRHDLVRGSPSTLWRVARPAPRDDKTDLPR